MAKQLRRGHGAIQQKENQARPPLPSRLVSVCYLLIYAIVVMLLCAYAAGLRRPSVAIAGAASGDIIPPPPLTGEIDLNTAGQDALRQLPGIGEKLSQAILDYREEYGRFDFAEDILYISGIGEKRLENMRPFITLSESP